MDLLAGSIRNYSWGSREMIPELCGRSVPSERPEAELWFGAHPAGSALVGDTPLVDIIAADPEGELGERVCTKFGKRLPFLLKILAAAEPLSLQAHPSLEQAKEGFARENEQEIPMSASNRNYKDDNHKPELIVALSQFEAMAGFRPLRETIELLEALNSHEVDHYIGMVDKNSDSEESDLRALFTTWITIPATARGLLIDAIVSSARDLLQTSNIPAWMRETLSNVIELQEQYPYDVGVLGALLLNKLTLSPGQALYLDAGQLHAYVKGLGVEIMANSDNVLRGGLTPKHVDVPELVRVLNFSSLKDPMVSTEQYDCWTTYRTPIEEFKLSVASISDSCCIDSDGPAIVMNVSGTVELEANGKTVVLQPGTAAWISAKDPQVTIQNRGDGEARLFLAEV